MVNATQGVLLQRCAPLSRLRRRAFARACATDAPARVRVSRRSDVQMTQFVVSMNEQRPTRRARTPDAAPHVSLP
jgi:hypothetical protein